MVNQELTPLIKEVANIIANSRSSVALTGAGISVESGVPPFRGKHGLWERYDPVEYAHIASLKRDPGKVWRMLGELVVICQDAQPNEAHISLARLEKMGLLDGIITQNIDGLHQKAGSREVVEFHGGNTTMSCMGCRKKYLSNDISLKTIPPLCSCGGVLRPDFVFFGEPIPQACIDRSIELAANCEVMIIIGTTGIVMPSAQMPYLAKSTGAELFEINPEKSAFSNIVDIFLPGKAAETMESIMANIPH